MRRAGISRLFPKPVLYWKSSPILDSLLSLLGKKTTVVHILWKKTDHPFPLCIPVFPRTTCELWGSTGVSATLLHPRAQGRLVGCSVNFPRLLGQGQSFWFPAIHLIFIYRYRRAQSMLVCDAGALAELHQYGLQKMKEQPSPRFT